MQGNHIPSIAGFSCAEGLKSGEYRSRFQSTDFGVRRREHPSAAAAPGTPPVAALLGGGLTPQFVSISIIGRDRSRPTKALTSQRTPKERTCRNELVEPWLMLC